MNACTCPHCGAPRIIASRVPKDVVVVLPCPNCHELVVLFRGKAVALSRRIMERGTFDERKMHIAEIIAEFLEPGMLGLPISEVSYQGEEAMEDELPAALEPEPQPRPRRRLGKPITEKEVDRFVRVDLNRIDEAAYFKKHFGK
ncbi:MAG: hypothetical protein AMXMBFR4_29180 [Candidatus Hydrogenedentota bacterium]